MKTRLLILTAVAAVAFAQGPGGPGRRGMGPMGFRGGAGPGAGNIDDIKAYLSLTDTQVQSLQALQTQFRQSAETRRSEMATKHKALRELLQSGTSDATAVGKLMLEIQALRSAHRDELKPLTDQARALLTEEQRAKLKTLEDAVALRDEVRQAARLRLLAPSEGGEAGPMMMRRQRFGPGRTN